MATATTTPIMVLLPYTPRADSAGRGYDKWLSEVDNPFFNGIPGIIHYSNWKVSAVLRGKVDFTYFDYMFLDPATYDQVWQNPTLLDFAADWNRLWGRDPDNADLSVNYHSYLMRCGHGSAEFDPRGTILAIDPSVEGVIGGASWTVFESMVGVSPAERYEVAFGTPREQAGDAPAKAIIAGELIAAP